MSALFPDFFGAVDDRRAGGLIVGIGETAAAAGAFLDHHLVVARDETGDTGGCDGDAVFFSFNLFGDADDHAPRLREGPGKCKMENGEWRMENGE